MSIEDIVINVIQGELLCEPSIQSAVLYRSTAFPEDLSLLLVLENEDQRNAIQNKVKLILLKIKTWAPLSSSNREHLLLLETQISFINQGQWTEIKRWDSFDPLLRKQLVRWGWLNSPLAYLWAPGILVIMMTLFYLFFNHFKK